MNQRRDDPPSHWDWPATDTLVDLTPYVLRKWTEHHGDSPITLARPHKRRGDTAPPPPAYLLKKTASAIGERTYYLLARLLDLPSTVALWADYDEDPVAAIRYEPAAWRPDRLAEQGIAASGDRIERLVNPLDEYRHSALYYLLGECDDIEFMVRDGVLFRIDAASVGDALWSAAVRAVAETVPGITWGTSAAQRVGNIAWGGEHLHADSPEGYAVYLDTLERVLRHPEWDEVVANDLRTCPARTWRMDLHKLPPLDELTSSQRALMQAWAEVPLMDHIADAYLARMAHQRAVIQQLLADAKTAERDT